MRPKVMQKGPFKFHNCFIKSTFFCISAVLCLLFSTALNAYQPSLDSVRSYVKIKFVLDPLLAGQNITLENKQNQLLLTGEVKNKISQDQALYFVDLLVASFKLNNLKIAVLK